MAFQRSHLRQRMTLEDYKAELKEDNSCFQEALQSEVNFNYQNEKRVNQLKRDYT